MKDNLYYPKNFAQWYSWLEVNHEKYKSVWLIYDKKSSGYVNISWSEAVDAVLCFGWIEWKKTKYQ